MNCSAKSISPIECFRGYESHPCRYGLFDRHGGVSKNHFASLNIGRSVGDRDESVTANRHLVRERLGVLSLLFARQVHGEEVYLLGEPLSEDTEVDGYDALITMQRNVGLVVQHADCQAVLLYDPERKAIGALHSGWRGSVINLIGRTIESMTDAFGTDPSQVQAVISPSLGPCCAEFVNYRTELPAEFQQFKDERDHFNFWNISKMQLVQGGLLQESITLPTSCTSCSNDYFSYRRACREVGGVAGRNCSVISLCDDEL